MTKRAICLIVMLSGSSINAADVSGQWMLKLDPDYRGNPGPWVECTFQQQGEKLTVTCGNGGEMNGKVRGRTVTFGYEKTGIPPMVEDRLVLTHTAEVSDTGHTLKGTWRLKSAVLDKDGSFQAKKKP